MNRLIKKPMRIRNLEDYNIPSYILDLWEKNYSPYLLPVQKKAVKDYGILDCGEVNSDKKGVRNDREIDSRFRLPVRQTGGNDKWPKTGN